MVLCRLFSSTKAFVRRSGFCLVASGLCAIHTLMLAWAATRHSPATDEAAQLVGGVYTWHFGRFDLCSVNPPLVRLIAATPVVVAGAKTDWTNLSVNPASRSEFLLGTAFMRANPEEFMRYFIWARWICIPFSLVGALVCLAWATDLYGRMAGVLALALWCFCPSVLGLGQLITTDMAAAALGLAAAFGFYRWLHMPTLAGAMSAGVLLGLSLLAKFTLLLFLGLWPLLWLASRCARSPCRQVPWGKETAYLGLIIGLALLVVNVGYAFDGSFSALGNVTFYSRALSGAEPDRCAPGNRFKGTWLAPLPIPLPREYLQGIDVQQLDFDRGDRSYLNGQWSNRGWWYYYLYALAIKVPLGMWLLGSFSLAVLGGLRMHWRSEVMLVLPAILILATVSLQTGFSHHMRYAFPALPFAIIWSSKVATVMHRRHRFLCVAATAAALWSIASSVSVYPHSLAYFNELVGGPRGGGKHLLHSNIDYGQDLLHLKKWLDAHPGARPVGIAVFGPTDPSLLNIRFDLPPKGPFGAACGDNAAQIGPRPGWFAVSVNFVMGMHHSTFDGQGRRRGVGDSSFTYFQLLEPNEVVGYSIYVYHVTLEEANGLRRIFGLAELTEGD